MTTQGVVACQDTRVRRGPYGRDVEAEVDPVWKASIKWERDTENLFALGQYLFYAPPEEELSWRPLHRV